MRFGRDGTAPVRPDSNTAGAVVFARFSYVGLRMAPASSPSPSLTSPYQETSVQLACSLWTWSLPHEGRDNHVILTEKRTASRQCEIRRAEIADGTPLGHTPPRPVRRRNDDWDDSDVASGQGLRVHQG